MTTAILVWLMIVPLLALVVGSGCISQASLCHAGVGRRVTGNPRIAADDGTFGLHGTISLTVFGFLVTMRVQIGGEQKHGDRYGQSNQIDGRKSPDTSLNYPKMNGPVAAVR